MDDVINIRKKSSGCIVIFALPKIGQPWKGQRPMGSRLDRSIGSRALVESLKQFPAHARQIEDLLHLDEDFRGLCEDLVDAQAALQETVGLPDEVRESRRIEYQELVDSLSGEITEALSKANVVLLRLPKV